MVLWSLGIAKYKIRQYFYIILTFRDTKTARNPMRRLALLVCSVLAISAMSAVKAEIPECYHDLQEMHQVLFDLAEQHPAVMKIDSIGHSSTDNLPIYLVKISDNVELDESYEEPATLTFGHIHGEEILGIEVILRTIEDLVTKNDFEFRERRANLETYFVPTMNPEGLEVVFGHGVDNGADVTFRKNKRDNIGDGVFRYQMGLGSDTSGVDPNRQFDFNWFHGDTLFTPAGAETYDYYRGYAPFSEPEAVAARKAFDMTRPLYGFTYHSSRTGNHAEKVYYPWNWKNDGGIQSGKTPPDAQTLDNIAMNVANRSHTSNGNTYEYSPSGGRNGKMHDWSYAEGGWMNMEMEIGTSEIQPPENIMNQIVEECQEAILYILDRAQNASSDYASGRVDTFVKDENGSPLVAEVRILGFEDGNLKPRMTNEAFGVHRWPLASGEYNVVVQAWGYKPDTTRVPVGNDFAYPHNVTLQALPKHNVSLRAIDGSTEENVPATYIVHRAFGVDTLKVEGTTPVNYSWPEGNYSVEVWAEGYIPRKVDFTLDQNYSLFGMLSEESVLYSNDFETELGDEWTSSGDFGWVRSGADPYEGRHAIKSSADRFITLNENAQLSLTIQIPDEAEGLAFKGYRRYEFEPDYDFCTVEVRADNGDWNEIEVLNGFQKYVPFFYDLNEYSETSTLEIRWSIETDDFNNDRGLFMDNIEVVVGGYLEVEDEKAAAPFSWELRPAYPNPFNPSTTVSFTVALEGKVKISVYDVLGREVEKLVDGKLAAGVHKKTLDMTGFSSGIYFLQMEADDFSSVQKVVLIK